MVTTQDKTQALRNITLAANNIGSASLALVRSMECAVVSDSDFTATLSSRNAENAHLVMKLNALIGALAEVGREIQSLAERRAELRPTATAPITTDGGNDGNDEAARGARK